MDEVARAFETLGLGVDATPDEVRKTRRDLAKIYHPDRFPDDARLRAVAEEKMKAVNAACTVVMEYLQAPEPAQPGAADCDRRDAADPVDPEMAWRLEEALWREAAAEGADFLTRWGLVCAVAAAIYLYTFWWPAGTVMAWSGWRVLRVLPAYLSVRRQLRAVRVQMRQAGMPTGEASPAIAGWLMTAVAAVFIVGGIVLVGNGAEADTFQQPAHSPGAFSPPAYYPNTTEQSSSSSNTWPLSFNTPGATTPEPGSSDRTGLMDASRAYLRTTTQFYVHDLKVKGAIAVGDIEPYPTGFGGRVQLAYERAGSGWRAVGRLGTGNTKPLGTTYSPSAWSPLTDPTAYTPEPGSTERTQLMDAARAHLGLDCQFYVHTLRVNGTGAVADIEPYPTGSGARRQLAYERAGTGWRVVDSR